MLRDWLDWHRATLLRKCAGLDGTRLARRAVPPSKISLLGLVRHLSDTERGWVRQAFRGEPVPDLYYRSDAPDADFEEADPAGAEEDFERYRAECRAVDAALEGAQAGRHVHAAGRRPPRCGGCGSTSWRSTRATTGTLTCSARPSTVQSASEPGLRAPTPSDAPAAYADLWAEVYDDAWRADTERARRAASPSRGLVELLAVLGLDLGVGEADPDGLVEVEALAGVGRDDGVVGDVGVVAGGDVAAGVREGRAVGDQDAGGGIELSRCW